jgi:glycosyltransferase involved in cell wall biosynthesis
LELLRRGRGSHTNRIQLNILKRLLPASTPVTVGAGVDLAELAGSTVCGARFRTKYGLQDKRLVLFVGRKERFKRYDVAIEALELIGDDRIHLVMIGRDIDHHAASSSRVTYLGEVSQDDLADAYDGCDVFVMPSENESFGMVFLEAWARRKPVIGNRACGGGRCLIDDGEDGYLCTSAEEIAGRIVQLVANPDLARKLGRAGYEKVACRYTWEAIAEKVRDLYSQLANGASTGTRRDLTLTQAALRR